MTEGLRLWFKFFFKLLFQLRWIVMRLWFCFRLILHGRMVNLLWIWEHWKFSTSGFTWFIFSSSAVVTLLTQHCVGHTYRLSHTGSSEFSDVLNVKRGLLFAVGTKTPVLLQCKCLHFPHCSANVFKFPHSWDNCTVWERISSYSNIQLFFHTRSAQ